MAFYLANHHITVARGKVKPGEVFEADFDHDVEARLIRVGAIQKVVLDEETERIVSEATGEADGEGLSANGNDPEALYQAEGADDTEDCPMEIDATDGISSGKKKAGRKKK